MLHETISFAEYYAIPINDYKDILITTLPFSARTMDRFKDNGIKTLADLLELSPFKLHQIKGFGKTCYEEVENFCESLQKNKSFMRCVKGNKQLNAWIILENIDDVTLGDFSFAENYNSNSEEYETIMQYKKAYYFLGEDIVFDCIYSPKKITPIIDMFNEYLCSMKQVLEVRELLSKIPFYRRKNRIKGYINTFTIKEDEREILNSFCEGEQATISSISCASFHDDKDYLLLMKFLKWCTFDLNKEITQLFEELYLNDRNRAVIRGRANKRTLEDIGRDVGVTRERIRQIEKRAKKLFARLHGRIRIISKISAERNGDNVLTPAEIEKYCGENSIELIYLLQSYSSTDYIYDKQLDVFIVGDDSLQGRVNAYIENLPDIINSVKLSEIVIMAKDDEDIPEEIFIKVFMDTYKLTGEIYHRYRLSLASIYEKVLRDHYPKGIYAYDTQEIKELREIIANEYGDVGLPENDRALTARITSICVLRGRGIYMLKQQQYMPQDLSKQIYSYIMESENTIFLTNTLFSVFEKELLEVGIDNKYYLQGVLREIFADDFFFSRDYVSKDASVTSIYTEIVEFIRKSEYPISKIQIQKQFPGITEIIINLAVGDPNILNYFGEYFHASHLKISEDERSGMFSIIKGILSDGKAHHSEEIYELLCNYNSDIFTRNAALYQFGAFSILEFLFGNQFQFSRPYIAEQGVEIERPAEQLRSKIYGSQEFSVDEISKFIKESHFQIQSILDFINSCNDEFLLVDNNRMMRIENLGINEEIARTVDEIISQEITETIPICSLSVWNKLPRIAIAWSEWLLYGVIKKWGKKTQAGTSSNQFKLSIPLVAPKGHLDVEKIRNMELSQGCYKIDDLDNIDDLLADIIDYDIFNER